MGDVEVERHHAAHRLTGGIKSVSIDVVFLADLFKQTYGHLHLVRRAPVVLYGPIGILRHEHK